MWNQQLQLHVVHIIVAENMNFERLSYTLLQNSSPRETFGIMFNSVKSFVKQFCKFVCK